MHFACKDTMYCLWGLPRPADFKSKFSKGGVVGGIYLINLNYQRPLFINSLCKRSRLSKSYLNVSIGITAIRNTKKTSNIIKMTKNLWWFSSFYKKVDIIILIGRLVKYIFVPWKWYDLPLNRFRKQIILGSTSFFSSSLQVCVASLMFTNTNLRWFPIRVPI